MAVDRREVEEMRDEIADERRRYEDPVYRTPDTSVSIFYTSSNDPALRFALEYPLTGTVRLYPGSSKNLATVVRFGDRLALHFSSPDSARAALAAMSRDLDAEEK